MNHSALPSTVADALRRYFGFEELRPGQAAALASVLAGRDTLVVMPTGAGKSLIYQLAALARPEMHPEGTTVVVSPLIALMKDQVDGLRARGIAAAYVNSSQTAAEQRAALEAVRSGLVRLVYVAPERLRARAFVAALAEAGVALLAVDEAHCVSQWGHDFRPDYRAIGPARRRLAPEGAPPPPCVALTATATPAVQDDIARALGLRDPARLVTGFNRPNVRLEVRSTPTARDKRAALAAFLAERPGEAGLVYVATRREGEALARYLADEAGLACGLYHAGLPDAARADVQERFVSGRLGLVVATNAFGMGVDRPDVRFVAHWGIPPTLEAYYQEAGRAGRDGRPAVAVLFYAPQDRQLREWFIEQQAPDAHALHEAHRALGRHADADGVARAVPDAVAEEAGLHAVGGRVAVSLLERAGLAERLDDEGPRRAWRLAPWDAAAAAAVLAATERLRQARADALAAVVAYAQDETCRRARLLAHFGDETAHGVPPEACCDACAARLQLREPPDEIPPWEALPAPARLALGLLDCVRRTPWPVGRRTLARILAGSEARGMARYARHPYFGRLRALGQERIDALYKQLLVRGLLRVGGAEYPVVELTSLGAQALDHREVVELDGADDALRATRPGTRHQDDAAPLADGDEALFERLRAWRADEARAQAVPPYVVFSDRTLRALAAQRPDSEAGLLAIPGIGPAKAAQYGEAVLRLVAEA